MVMTPLLHITSVAIFKRIVEEKLLYHTTISATHLKVSYTSVICSSKMSTEITDILPVLRLEKYRKEILSKGVFGLTGLEISTRVKFLRNLPTPI